MKRELSIRLATVHDSTLMERIERIVYPHSWTRVEFERRLRVPGAGAHIAESGEAIAFNLWRRRGAQLEIVNLATINRGEGIGPQLLRAMIQELHLLDPTRLWLKARVSNDKAIHFYERCGFHSERLIPNCWKDNGEAGVLMSATVQIVSQKLEYQIRRHVPADQSDSERVSVALSANTQDAR